MTMQDAIGLLETKGLVALVEATDAMAKAANVQIAKRIQIGGGLVTTVVRLPAYALSGLITTPRLVSAVVLLPAALLGGWVGHRVHIEVSEQRFRSLISVALCLIGLLLLLR